jgi:hypothetical protein
MTSDNGPLPAGRGGEPISRRTAVFELAGIALVLAIPIAAALTTANPIPDPPSRRRLNFPLPVDLPAEQQQQGARKEQRRAGKKQRRAGKKQREERTQQRARDASQPASRDQVEQLSDTKRRASQP